MREEKVSVTASLRELITTYIDKLFPFLLLCTPSLIFENNVIIPPALKVEVLRIEKRIPSSDIHFPLLLLLCGSFLFLWVGSV